MSRYYRIEVDVDRRLAAVRYELLEQGMEIDGEAEIELGRSYYGHTTLSGGQGPEEAHEELFKGLKEHGVQRIETRWLNMDALEWDEILGGLVDEEEDARPEG